MEFVVDFQRQNDVPLYRGLSEAIKLAIKDGRLRPGEKIPSIRDLCELVDVSRNTAFQCYQTLISEGYLESVKGKGVFVSKPMHAESAQPPRTQPPISENKVSESISSESVSPDDSRMIATLYRLQSEVVSHQSAARALGHQMPSLEDLPVSQLNRTLSKHARLSDPALVAYSGDPFGHPMLREAITNYVLRARAIKCHPDQVVVTSRPSQQMLDLFCRLFLKEGDTAAVEHPGYSQPRQIFEINGARVLPIPVDDDGLRIDALTSVRDRISMLYVTPSHQDPTGAILTLTRRQQLVMWARQNDVVVWEDDVDNEYRYGSEPLPALYALDKGGKVIYQSTFWRTLCPLIRLGFVILPAGRTREIVHMAKYMLDRDLPVVEQLALADLINEGHFERHIKTMRKKFTARRQVAVHGLKVGLGRLVSINKSTSGLHLRATFNSSIENDVIVRHARESGLAITGTQAFYCVGDAPLNEFLIQFAHVEESQLKRQIEEFSLKLKSQAAMP